MRVGMIGLKHGQYQRMLKFARFYQRWSAVKIRQPVVSGGLLLEAPGALGYVIERCSGGANDPQSNQVNP